MTKYALIVKDETKFVRYSNLTSSSHFKGVISVSNLSEDRTYQFSVVASNTVGDVYTKDSSIFCKC